jgi:hypothetical protein
VADLCCGIGGDLLALGNATATIGVDQSPIATHLAAANARAVLNPLAQKRISLQTCDVQRFALADVSAWHLDPDRRPSGSRTTSLAWSSPPLPVVEQLLVTVPHAAIKLAPAAQVSDAWQERCELEWIGRDRQCRQLVAWHGNLAQAPGLRRATVLAGDDATPSDVRTVVGKPDQIVPITDRLERFILEPDPAVLAAHLTGALAAEHGLAALATGPSYLTGSLPVDDAALACFEVEEVLPAKIRTLAQSLRERGIGQLEIKKRGVDLDPERVRRELKLRGELAATLLFTPLAGRQVAILARRIKSRGHASDLQPLDSDL